VPRKPTPRKSATRDGFVNFNVGDRTYQIDPQRQKVYRQFVEVETSKAFAIYSVWRSQNAMV